MQACASTGTPLRGRYRITRFDDGELRWMETRGEAQYEDGDQVRIVGAIADVTDHIRAEEQARADHAFQRAVIEASPDIIFVYDLATRSTTWSNRSQLQVLGYQVPADGDAPVSADEFVPAEERSQFDAALAAAASSEPGEVIQINHRLVAADGSDRWFSRRITALRRDHQGRVTQLVGVLRDITEAVAAEQQLRHSALHDNLTGLPNRALLMDRIETAHCARSGRARREISVLFCDLDGFKRINDTAGHAAGDAVLSRSPGGLQSRLREGDTVARVGGDEFVLIVEPWNRNGSDDLAPPGQDRAAATADRRPRPDALRRPVIGQRRRPPRSASASASPTAPSCHPARARR